MTDVDPVIVHNDRSARSADRSCCLGEKKLNLQSRADAAERRQS
jgi:hypothetical protein